MGEEKTGWCLRCFRKKEKQLVEEMLTGRGGEPLQEIVRENTDVKSLSALIKKKYKKIADVFVPKEFRKNFLCYVGQMQSVSVCEEHLQTQRQNGKLRNACRGCLYAYERLLLIWNIWLRNW